MRAFCFDGKIKNIPFVVKKSESIVKVTVDTNFDFSDIKYIDFEYESALAQKGDNGYFVIPNSPRNESMLCYFKERNDIEYISSLYTMPIFGVKTDEKSFVAIITGMAYTYTLICGVKNGRYYIYPRFEIDGQTPYENISVEYHYLNSQSCNYSVMAREYRNYQISRGACKPIKERAAESVALSYAKDSIMIRIRMGWKPVPTPVLEQTLDNEPDMFTACSFKQVAFLLDRLKLAGVEKAEICLVGWNQKGHDGRWPSPFPVCEELGGEEELRKLIKKAQDLGYQIACHTNSTDSYRISPMFSEDDLRRDKEGNAINSGYWSGGKMYELCPLVALKQAEELLPQISKLGFYGLHYIDVISIVNPRDCYDSNHPLNTAQAIECNKRIMHLSKKLFGGFSSEGVMDFAAEYLDYGLYVSFSEENQPPICDKVIPLWQLVYHGIIMSNPSAKTVNYPIKSIKEYLKVIEYGGRPTIYLNSKFVNSEQKTDQKNARNWMGETDIICRNGVSLDETVNYIKEAYRDCEQLSYLQTEFMEEHTEVSPNVYRVTYSDGTVITVDHNKLTYEVRS